MDKLVDLLTTYLTHEQINNAFISYNSSRCEADIKTSIWRHLAGAIGDYDVFIKMLKANPTVFIEAIRDIEIKTTNKSTLINETHVELCIIASGMNTADLHVLYMMSTNHRMILEIDLIHHLERFKCLNELFKLTDTIYHDSSVIIGFYGDSEYDLLRHLAVMITPSAKLIRKFNAANRYMLETMKK